MRAVQVLDVCAREGYDPTNQAVLFRVESMKKHIAAFAYVILRGVASSCEMLVVRRSPNDRYFPNMWGLPAGTLRKNEVYEEAIRRTARHRLGIEVEVL